MPQPDYMDGPWDPMEAPNVALEIVGRGDANRKSKTYLEDKEIATMLSFIRGHIKRLEETFRHLHARKYTVPVSVEGPDGEEVVEYEPEVLSLEALRKRYPVIAEWERAHQEVVEHYASIEGFSIIQAAGQRGEPGRRREESSAGADASKEENPRWR